MRKRIINKYIYYPLIASCLVLPAAAQQESRAERMQVVKQLRESDAQMEQLLNKTISENHNTDVEDMQLPPLAVFLDAVTENATVKQAQSKVMQLKNELRLQQRDWWNYFHLNGSYAYGVYNTLNDNSSTYDDWYQTATASARHTFSVGASMGISLGDLFNRKLKLKRFRYDIEQQEFAQEEVMEARRLKVLDAYNAVTEQLATIKAKAESAALYNAQMKISENNYINGTIDIISLSLERGRRSTAVVQYEQARVSLHNAIVLLEMLTNVKIISKN